MTEEPGKCRLLGGMFAILVQMCLAFICIGTLVVKRHQERPQRNWIVWFMDATKQGLGSGFGHFSNIYLSMIIAESLNLPETTETEGSLEKLTSTQSIHKLVSSIFLQFHLRASQSNSKQIGDECQWYCTTYVLDATLGTAFNLMLLYGFVYLIKSISQGRGPSRRNDIIELGYYGDPPQLSLFLPQLAMWLVIVVVGKLLMLLALSFTVKPIDDFVSEIFKPIQKYPELELVLVMILIPTCLNALQFWLTDSFLKRQPETIESDSSVSANSYLNHDSDEEDMEDQDFLQRKNSRLIFKKKEAPETELTIMNSRHYTPVWTSRSSMPHIPLLPNGKEDEESVYFNMDSQDENENHKNSNKHSSYNRIGHDNEYKFVSSGKSVHPTIAGDVQQAVSHMSRAVSQVVSATVAPIYPSRTHTQRK